MPPRKKLSPSLPNAEVQTLANRALAVWQTGIAAELVDSLGAVWVFEPVRDQNARLEIHRDDLAGHARMTAATGAELGTDNAAAILASRILALASP